MIGKWRKRKKESHSEVFFIRGFQRSGTNWVCNLMNLHQDVKCVGEFHFRELYQAKKHLINRKYGLISRKPNKFGDHLDSLIKSLIIDYCDNAQFCGDRTPEALDSVLIPGAKYILIHRDPRDIMVSWIYHLFNINHTFGKGMEAKKKIFQENPNYFETHKSELFNTYWARKIATDWNRRVMADSLTMENIDKGRMNVKYLFVKYEDLINDTDDWRMKMYTTIGADPSKAKSLSDHTKPGFKKHDPKSHYRLGAAGKWKEYFTEENLIVFEKVALNGLRKLGYPTFTI